MSRRVRLPGADELFRATAESPVVQAPGERPRIEAVPDVGTEPAPGPAAAPATRRPAARPARSGARQPTGRERHDEKITVYVSADELIDLEQARLQLRREHGVAVDRGRIVREAVALVLADLDAKGEDSILVRRLRGH